MFEMNFDDIPQEHLDRRNRAELCFGENGEEAPYGSACQQTKRGVLREKSVPFCSSSRVVPVSFSTGVEVV